MEKEKQILFSLQSIKMEQFAMFQENYQVGKELNIQTGVNIKADISNKQLGVFLEIAFEQTSKIIIKIAVSCHFKIVPKSWESFINVNESKLIVPKKIASHLTMITVGTTRGVLFSKLEGTQFSAFILPTLNVTDSIKNDISFELDKV